MPARVQIEIDVKDAASGVLRAITTQFGTLGKVGSDFANMIRSSDDAVKLYNKALIDTSISVDDVRQAEELAAIATGRFYEQIAMLAFDALKDVINTTVEYAQEVRDLSLLQGQGTEAASRFLQVLDDYQLTADDAKAATRALTREGLAPTIDTIAELSAQYNALTDVEEKNAFVQKNLGRAGQEWMNLLAQGPDKIRAMNDAVSDGLILSAENIQAAEDYRLALDQWNDSMQEVKTTLGNELLPTLAEGASYTLESSKAVQEEVKWYERLLPAVGAIHTAYIAIREAVTGNTDATQEGTTVNGEYASSLEEVEARMKAQEEAAKALEKETTTYYKGLISSIQDAQAETDRFVGRSTELLAKQSSLNAEIAKATRVYGANSKKVQDLQGELKDVEKELDDNAKAHQKWAAQTVFAFAQARAAADGNISKGEGEMLIAVGEQLDLFDQKTADAMRSVNEAFDDLDVSNAESSINAVQRAMEQLTGKTWTINITTNTSGATIPDNYYDMPSCFIADTLVKMADGTEKKIQDVRVGDRVSAYNTERKEMTTATVGEVFDHSPSEMGSCYLMINNIGVTKEHPIFSSGAWKRADELRVGDSLLCSDGSIATVSRVKAIYKRVHTYNLHVNEEEHNYFAGGILVHNKQQGGAVYAGNIYPVGESGMERFVPSMNGRILGNAESLHALQMSGGGNYFYGPVSISAGSDAGGDVLSLR